MGNGVEIQMNILKEFKNSEEGEIFIHLERLWLIENDKNNDGFTPRLVDKKYFKYVFIGKVKDYLETDYNITKYVDQNQSTLKFISKYKYAIQLTYPYIGSDDSKLGKEVISLWLVKNDEETMHYQRIWQEI
jgi:hypothetical protein